MDDLLVSIAQLQKQQDEQQQELQKQLEQQWQLLELYTKKSENAISLFSPESVSNSVTEFKGYHFCSVLQKAQGYF